MNEMGGSSPDPRILRELARRLESEEVPSWLHARVMGAVRREAARRPRSEAREHRPGRRPSAWRALAGAAVLAVLVLVVAGSPMLRDRLAALAPAALERGATGQGGRSSPPAKVRAEDLLPRSGRYATLDGYPAELSVRRDGSLLRVTETLPGPSSPPGGTAKQVFQLVLRGGCLEQEPGVAGGMAASTAREAPVVWLCAPPQAAGGHEAAPPGPAQPGYPDQQWTEDPTFGRVLRVRSRLLVRGQPLDVERSFAPGKGLVRVLQRDERGQLLEEWVLLGGPAARRPLTARLPYVPFGAAAQDVPYRLVTPADLPFSLYVPADSPLVPGGFQVEAVQVGEARGIRYGLLDQRSMVTEVVFLPPGASLDETVRNMLRAMVEYRKAPYDLIFQEAPTDASAPWVIRNYAGSSRNDPTMTGTAAIGRYRDRYFYLIRVGWYEQASVADLQSWQWEDGRGFQQGLTGGDSSATGGAAAPGSAASPGSGG
ncbi:MAG: hypothetical protein QJR14_08680 [Bacillota bacterium]|nr:hypothetical protein [Bacillota bacterium]